MLRLLTGIGGVALIASLFLPWADGTTGWELLSGADLLFAIAGLFALATALTGGQIGFFRPDMSLSGAADLLGVVSSVALGWLILGESADAAGVYVALAAAVAVFSGAGDYATLRGAPLFPRLHE